MGTDKVELKMNIDFWQCINNCIPTQEVRLARYLEAIPEGSRVRCMRGKNVDVIAIARTPFSNIKYYDRSHFNTFGELKPIEPLRECKWDEMDDTDYARRRWYEELYGRTVD